MVYVSTVFITSRPFFALPGHLLILPVQRVYLCLHLIALLPLQISYLPQGCHFLMVSDPEAPDDDWVVLILTSHLLHLGLQVAPVSLETPDVVVGVGFLLLSSRQLLLVHLQPGSQRRELGSFLQRFYQLPRSDESLSGLGVTARRCRTGIRGTRISPPVAMKGKTQNHMQIIKEIQKRSKYIFPKI